MSQSNDNLLSGQDIGQPNELAVLYRGALLDDVIPFWESRSVDRECGGFFTCLDREGQVYDTDKFIWLQARQVWMFATLCSCIEERQEWLDMALHGAGFLLDHGHDAEGRWYFSLNRQGTPLMQPYSIASDCFAAMGFSALGRVTGDTEHKRIAIDTYDSVMRRLPNPKGQYEKRVPGTRPLKPLGFAMGIFSLVTELEWLLEEDAVSAHYDMVTSEVLNTFLDTDYGVLREHVAPDGSHVDSFEGRLIDCGHGIETLWLLMQVAERRGDRESIDRAVDIIISTLEFGWDREFGGLYCFMDIAGHPPQQLEWNQKLWWPHAETLIALAMAWRLTGRDDCKAWYQRVHDYAWGHFPDPGHGEWFGYLDRRGEVLLNLKGGKWKGCFHVPRALLRCYQEFSAMG